MKILIVRTRSVIATFREVKSSKITKKRRYSKVRTIQISFTKNFDPQSKEMFLESDIRTVCFMKNAFVQRQKAVYHPFLQLPRTGNMHAR